MFPHGSKHSVTGSVLWSGGGIESHLAMPLVANTLRAALQNLTVDDGALAPPTTGEDYEPGKPPPPPPQQQYHAPPPPPRQRFVKIGDASNGGPRRIS